MRHCHDCAKWNDDDDDDDDDDEFCSPLMRELRLELLVVYLMVDNPSCHAVMV